MHVFKVSSSDFQNFSLVSVVMATFSSLILYLNLLFLLVHLAKGLSILFIFIF